MRAAFKALSEAFPVLMAGASVLLLSSWSCGHRDSYCLAETVCPSSDTDDGTWVASKQPCTENEVYPCEKVTECGGTIYCRLMPDTDTDDTDSETDTGSTTVPDCQTGNTTIEWLPNPTSDYDCGPGCVQVVFEQPNPIVEWDVKGRYLSYSTQGPPLAQARIVDLQKNCYAKLYHPEYSESEVRYAYPSIDGETATYSVSVFGAIKNYEIATIEVGSGVWKRCLMESAPQGEGSAYVNPVKKGGIIGLIVQSVQEAPRGQAVLFNVVAEELSFISQDKRKLSHLRISGDHVVWTDHTGNVADIHVHRISTGETWNLTNHSNGQFAPRIDGTRVVWTDLRHGGGAYSSQATWNHADIFMYDFATDELTAITNQDWLQLYPDIDGDRIVWQDSRDCSQPNNAWDWGGIDIWMYDISTGQQHQITNLPGPEGDPRIDGNRVFFMAYHPEGYSTIFMQDLAALGL